MREYIALSQRDAALEKRVRPALAAVRTEGFFLGYDQKPLHYACYQTEKSVATVVVLHGFSESAQKYDELVHYLLREGYAVATYDHRGHGRSHRIVEESLIHIDRFEEYVDDLECFLRQVVQGMPAPRFLFAHSMGGGVAALYLEKHPDAFARVALSAPMISTRYGGIARALCRTLCLVAAKTGGEKRRIFLFRDKNKGPSYRWGVEAMGVTRKILARGKPERIKIPVLLLAAEHDDLVNGRAQRVFARRLPKGAYRRLAGTHHELYSTNDAARHAYFDGIFDFFAEAENA